MSLREQKGWRDGEDWHREAPTGLRRGPGVGWEGGPGAAVQSGGDCKRAGGARAGEG